MSVDFSQYTTREEIYEAFFNAISAIVMPDETNNQVETLEMKPNGPVFKEIETLTASEEEKLIQWTDSLPKMLTFAKASYVNFSQNFTESTFLFHSILPKLYPLIVESFISFVPEDPDINISETISDLWIYSVPAVKRLVENDVPQFGMYKDHEKSLTVLQEHVKKVNAVQFEANAKIFETIKERTLDLRKQKDFDDALRYAGASEDDIKNILKGTHERMKTRYLLPVYPSIVDFFKYNLFATSSDTASPDTLVQAIILNYFANDDRFNLHFDRDITVLRGTPGHMRFSFVQNGRYTPNQLLSTGFKAESMQRFTSNGKCCLSVIRLPANFPFLYACKEDEILLPMFLTEFFSSQKAVEDIKKWPVNTLAMAKMQLVAQRDGIANIFKNENGDWYDTPCTFFQLDTLNMTREMIASSAMSDNDKAALADLKDFSVLPSSLSAAGTDFIKRVLGKLTYTSSWSCQ